MCSLKHLIIFILLCVVETSLRGQALDEKTRFADAPSDVTIEKFSDDRSYYDILETWDHVDSLNNWISKHFEYDMSRALKLGEGSIYREPTKILSPEKFCNNPRGVCLDLSRFTVETLKKIYAEYEVNYLMIEFEPLEINGIILRKHWIAVYKDSKGLLNFLGDSKYPGEISEGYKNVHTFINDYEIKRNRDIVNYNIVPSYKKLKRQQAKKYTGQR